MKRESTVLLLYEMLVHPLLDSSAQLCFLHLKKEVLQVGEIQRRANTASKGMVQLSTEGRPGKLQSFKEKAKGEYDLCFQNSEGDTLNEEPLLTKSCS